MILFSRSFDKVRTQWDFIEGYIDNVRVQFYFTMHSRRGYFHFMKDGVLYKMPIVTPAGFDVYEYLYWRSESLYTKKMCLEIQK